MPSLQPFSGPRRKLVLAFDIGTTYSGISYALLDPGEVPKVLGVTRFPGHENVGGDSKIPSILYYGQDGSVRAVGAEAALPAMQLEAEDEDYIYVEWFKLHLRPDSLDSDAMSKDDLPALPPGKDVMDVFTDFMRYLFSCARQYIVETHANGQSMWNSVAATNNIDFVLTHPNGWEGLQQMKMREAAVAAGLIPGTDAGRARVQFVTEGEASLHYCMHSGLSTESIKNGHGVMIVDAGGGTVDLSMYEFTTVSPLTVEEICAPDCVLQGSTRINARALTFLQGQLKNSAYGNDEDIKTMMEYFEKSAKPVFKSATEPSYIRMGSMKCNDPDVNIKRGQLILSGSNMASFFEPSVISITEAIERQRKAAPSLSVNVFLVGGFAASPWLFARLLESCANLGLSLSRPDSHTSKAVADGAISFYLEHFVSVRLTKVAYGNCCNTPFDPLDPEHLKRRGRMIKNVSGHYFLPDAFAVILPKDTRTREDEERRHTFSRSAREPGALKQVVTHITCYRGKEKDPLWTDCEPEMFSDLCTVHADTSGVSKTLRVGANGPYYLLQFDVILSCGLTELKAQISWMDNGVEKRGPAQIVYDDAAERVRA